MIASPSAFILLEVSKVYLYSSNAGSNVCGYNCPMLRTVCMVVYVCLCLYKTELYSLQETEQNMSSSKGQVLPGIGLML